MRPDDVPAFFHDAAVDAIKQKAAVAALMAPATDQTQLRLLKLFLKDLRNERTTDRPEEAQERLFSNINAMLSALPFPVANIDSQESQTEDVPAETTK